MRITSLDSLRFLAALGVAVHHFDINLRLGLDRYLAIGRFGLFVDFFFCLSGFVIALTYADRIRTWSDYGEFMRRRLARIYPLHLLTLLAFLSLGIAAGRLGVPINHPEFFDPAALPANLLLVQAWGFVGHGSFNHASWSISAELFLYLFFPLFAWASRARFATILAAIVLYVAALIWLRSADGMKAWTEATHDFGHLRAVPTFFFGVAVARVLPMLKQSFRPGWSSVWGLLLTTFAAMQFGLPDEAVVIVMAALMVTCACADFAHAEGLLKTRTFAMLGDASYAIYMIHGLVLLTIAFPLQALFGRGWWLSFAIGVAATFLTVAASIVLYRLVETPARRLLSTARVPPGGSPALQGAGRSASPSIG